MIGPFALFDRKFAFLCYNGSLWKHAKSIEEKKQARTEIAKNRLLGFVGYVGIVLVMFRVNISFRAGVFGRRKWPVCI
jgi:hypothetical protein